MIQDPGDQIIPKAVPHSTDPTQRGLFDERFDGADYADTRDRPRLTAQLQRVYDVMSDGAEHGIERIAEATGDPAQSVARQIRYLRAKRFGGHQVDRIHKGGGLYHYRLVL